MAKRTVAEWDPVSPAGRLLLWYGASALALVGVGAALFVVGDIPGSWFLALIIAFVVFGSATFGLAVAGRRRLVRSVTSDIAEIEGHSRTKHDQ
jgi:hypothetical protein